jgi:predicted nuclease with TOPRIM domain
VSDDFNMHDVDVYTAQLQARIAELEQENRQLREHHTVCIDEYEDLLVELEEEVDHFRSDIKNELGSH